MEIITLTRPGAETEFEYDYVYSFLLSKSNSFNTNGPQRVLVYSGHGQHDHPSLSEINSDDVLIHLSNESLRYNYRFLSRSNIVLRQYYNPFVWKRNCYTIPLGWKTGMGNHEKLIGSHDKYMFCFIGQIKGYRKPMYESFCQIAEHGFFSMSEKWNSNQLTDEYVKQIYLESAFALVPFGTVHADTMRIMEVLEFGCIPVVVKYMHEDYFKYIYGNHPFIVGKDWPDARKKVEALWADKKLLREKQTIVSNWYSDYKKKLLDDVGDILMGKRPHRGEQWKYQKLGRFNPYILLSWYYHFYYKKKPIY